MKDGRGEDVEDGQSLRGLKGVRSRVVKRG